MKRLYHLMLIVSLVLMCFTSCSSAENNLESLLSERDALQHEVDLSVENHNILSSEKEVIKKNYDKLLVEHNELMVDHNDLKKEYEKLVEDSSDWLELTEKQKAAEIAQAEADKIAAELAAQVAAEEKAKADKKAKEEAAKKAAEEEAKKAAEEKKGYDTGITYNQLARDPDDYFGKKVKFKGEVLQVSEVGSEIQIRLATKKNSWGGYSDNVVYLYFDESLIKSRILDDDIITIYGVSHGLHTYTTVLGSSVTLPLIEVDKIDS